MSFKARFFFRHTAVSLICFGWALSSLETRAAVPAQPTRVLMLCVDGLHELDLANYIASHPASAMARLVASGARYTSATTVRPSDSFPTFLALITGGSPASTGVYYDDSYDRSLWPPGITSGPTGVSIVFNETIDISSTALNGGGGINVNQLPRDPKRGGAPVYPHDYLRVNTIFEVVRASGGRTAYCEKHLSYEIAHGPSGKGVDDLFTPEIAANNNFGVSITKSVPATEDYDDLKVDAVVQQIDGLDHAGLNSVGVPILFGMNFQAVSVAQRLSTSLSATSKKVTIPGQGGYLDGIGTPGLLVADALDHTDASIDRILSELQANNLADSTYVILVGKHGNSPMDPEKVVIAGVQSVNNPKAVDLAKIVGQATPVLKVTADDGGLIWLQDQTQVDAAVEVLRANKDDAHIDDILYGASLKAYWPDPLLDPRTPDIMVFPKPGTIYTTSTKRIAEHGGWAEDDTHVALVVSHPTIRPETRRTPVNTTQVAPTILQLLGLNPFSLEAVVQERTPLLPGFEPLQAGGMSLLPPGNAAFDPPGILRFDNGQAQLQLIESRSRTYVLQFSTDLTTWVSVSTNSLESRGVLGPSSVPERSR
ncbi:MAG: alkaline phosphatase family protein [Verrucomicrobia bacterium]|nr:alkaline phosphatase family protein [Verrucomicrobiota bacterium]